LGHAEPDGPLISDYGCCNVSISGGSKTVEPDVIILVG
jgi:hypothetical protein